MIHDKYFTEGKYFEFQSFTLAHYNVTFPHYWAKFSDEEHDQIVSNSESKIFSTETSDNNGVFAFLHNVNHNTKNLRPEENFYKENTEMLLEFVKNKRSLLIQNLQSNDADMMSFQQWTMLELNLVDLLFIYNATNPDKLVEMKTATNQILDQYFELIPKGNGPYLADEVVIAGAMSAHFEFNRLAC